jgi:Domain of unknown function (DUF5655)
MRRVRASAPRREHAGEVARAPRQSASPQQAEEFFAGSELGLAACRRVQSVLDAIGPCEVRVARTQVGWARRRGFAFLWMPGRWLRNPGAEVVLTIASDRRFASPRWKQVAEARPGLFTHHLELRSAADVDDEVAAWLEDAYRAAE